MTRKIIPYQFEQALGHFKEPSTSSQYLNERTKVAIKNAWDRCAIIDNFGRVWVQSESVHTLLRTSQSNAKYLIAGVPDQDKSRYNNKLLIRGTAICQLLDFNIQNARSLQRENYIRYSELFYKAIRDCSKARELRAEFYEHLNRIISRLKQERINNLGISYDELTGDNLNLQTCEFSHIRSVSLYPELAGLFENGLIVNKEIHSIITQNSINDESELEQLCMLKNWGVNWLQDYGNF